MKLLLRKLLTISLPGNMKKQKTILRKPIETRNSTENQNDRLKEDDILVQQLQR